MMKGWLTLFLCFLSLALPAQEEAKALLERTAEAVRSSEGIVATFSVQAQGETGEGTIWLRGSKFKLETEGIVTWFDGRTQWTLVEATEEVNVSEPSAEELQAINPYAWLSLYKQGYSVKFADEANAGERAIVMTSTRPRTDMQCIVLVINERTLAPVRLTMAGRGGRDVAVIFIRSYDATRKYPEEMFTFPAAEYPEVEVVDLR